MRALCLALAAWVAARADDPWADRVISYTPVSPQAGFDDPFKALGAPLGISPSEPNNEAIVTLGRHLGSITLAFDTPVTDDPRNPLGLDCIVYSNCLWIGGNPQRKFQEPALIEISEDVNENGLADDPWYLIPGSLMLRRNSLPLPPEPAGESDTDGMPPHLMMGIIVNPNSLDGNPATDPLEFHWGYAELTPTAAPYLDNYVRPDDPRTVGLTPRSGGGDAFDIAWAVDDAGRPANLTRFHFIRLTTLVFRQFGILGFASSEIQAVADVAPEVDGDGDGILDEYEVRVAGTDPARSESTLLALEVPAIEGGSPAGMVLGVAQDARGNAIRLYSAGPRTSGRHTMTVDIRRGFDTGARLPVQEFVKSGAAREFVCDVEDFVGEQIEPAEFTIRYEREEIRFVHEPGLRPFRFDGAAYTEFGISDVAVNTRANRVTFRSRFPGLFILASYPGSGDDGAEGPEGSIVLSAVPAGGTVADPSNRVELVSGTIHTASGQPVPDGSVFTVTTTAGLITTPDTDPGMPGIQVWSFDGRIRFTVQAPTTSGQARFAATSVFGSAFGEMFYTFRPGPPAPLVTFRTYVRELDDPIVVFQRSDPVRDRFGNIVEDNTPLTIAADGAVIVSGDADDARPGHQVLTEGGMAQLVLEVPREAEIFRLDYFGADGRLINSQRFERIDFHELPAGSWAALAVVLGVLGCRVLRGRGE